MAKPDEHDLEWIERVKSEGAVPLLDPDNCPNGWATPPGDIFMVRGPEYLSTKVKIPGGDYLLKPLGFDWIKSYTKISEILNNPRSRIRQTLEVEFPTGEKPFVWAFNLQVPSKENFSAVAYFVSLKPITEGSLMLQFLKGDNAFWNSRLKLIANIVKGPWIVRKAVGEQAICVIGRALTCKYCLSENFVEVDIDIGSSRIVKGPWIVRKAVGEQAICVIGRALTCKYCLSENFIEVDIDIGSSMVASAIVHLAFGYLTTLTVDLAFLIEGQTESELPERLLGAVRFSELNAALARPMELPSYGSADSSQSSLPTRLWKSIGHGFSHLIHPVGQENVNGVDDHEEIVEDVKK